MKFKPTKGKDSVVSEHFVLMIKPKVNSSKFYNYNYYVTDSTMASLKSKNPQGGYNVNTGNLKKAKYPMGVVNNDTEFYLIKTLDGDSYKIKQERPTWKVSDEKKNWKNYSLQKATTKINGREWTVWFSNEIPVSEGPYLFKGLPGLVFFANDNVGDYNFELLSLNKNDLVNDYFPSIMKKNIDLTAEKYQKVYKSYILDPTKQLREGIYVDDSGIKMKMIDGLNQDMIKNIEQERLDKIKKFNNFIDLE